MTRFHDQLDTQPDSLLLVMSVPGDRYKQRLPQHSTAEVRFRFGIGLARLTIEFFEARPRVFNRSATLR